MPPTTPPPPAPPLPPPPPPLGPMGSVWTPTARPLKAPPRFPIRAPANGRIVLLAAAVGLAFDLACRQGMDSISGLVLVGATAAALLASRRMRGRSARLLVAAAPVLALALALRASSWVLVPVVLAVLLALVLGASFGADGHRFTGTFPQLAARGATVLANQCMGGDMLRPGPLPGPIPLSKVRSAARGIGLGLPVVLVIGLLLSSADPVFASWFQPGPLLGHAALFVVGAWIALSLVRAASAEEPVPGLPAAPKVGVVETVCVLGGLCLLYAAFVLAQIVTLYDGADHVLETRGLTYADYARSGFFQLLWAAAITLVVLLSVRAATDSARRIVLVLSELTVLLTLAVVVVAVVRLQLYEGAYGLTTIRLASTATAVWIGVVFVIVAVAAARPRGQARWLAPAIVVSALLAVGAWALLNPAALVARTNVGRAEHGKELDVEATVRLGPDAVPTLVRALDTLPRDQAEHLRDALCAPERDHPGPLAYNVSRDQALADLAAVCPD